MNNIVGWALWAMTVFGIGYCSTGYAAGGPENVLLVVNQDDPSSVLIANFYAHHRNIPARNVVFLPNVSPRHEDMHQKTFKQKVLAPILKAITERNIGSNIDYIVYSSGFPSFINVSNDYKRLVTELKRLNNGRDVQNKRLLTANASINSVTYFFRKFLAGDPSYIGLGTNRYMRGSCRQLLDFPFFGQEQAEFEKAMEDYKAKDFAKAANRLKPLSEKHPLQYAVHYWLARIYAQRNDSASAIDAMSRAIRSGWEFRTYTKSDPALRPLEDDKLFQAVIKRIPDKPFVFVPTHGFRSRYSWGPNGLINRSTGSGDGYVLSTVLGVTRNEGMSEKDTLDYLKRSIAADGTHPKGRFYFTSTTDVRTKTRVPNFPLAIGELKNLGFDSQIVTGTVPRNANDVIGVTMGASKFDWVKSRSTLLPGAIGENLTSFGGKLAPGTGQTKLFEFLRNGAAGSSGTVVEPYAVQPKFPHPRIHVHYVRGCTLAESFYQSVQGPFQLLIVGDALCQPWAVRPRLEIKTSFDKEHPKRPMTLSMDASKSPVKISRLRFYMDGRLFSTMPATDSVRFDTVNWPDGYHELRVVPVASNAIETQNSYAFDLMIDNKGQRVKLSADRLRVNDNEKIKLTFDAPGASGVKIFHHWRVVGAADGEAGTITLDAASIGRGPVTLRAVGEFEGMPVTSSPLKMNILGVISRQVPAYKNSRGKKK